MLTVISRIQNLVAINTNCGGTLYNMNEQVTSVTKQFNWSSVTEKEQFCGPAEEAHWDTFFNSSRKPSEFSINFDCITTTTFSWFLVFTPISSDLCMENHRLVGAMASCSGSPSAAVHLAEPLDSVLQSAAPHQRQTCSRSLAIPEFLKSNSVIGHHVAKGVVSHGCAFLVSCLVRASSPPPGFWNKTTNNPSWSWWYSTLSSLSEGNPKSKGSIKNWHSSVKAEKTEDGHV